ncbi:hypothetical protein EMMF5_003744 [Cystobasidiomycetes sp. EMM_F5]
MSAHETEIDSLIASAHSAYIVLRMMPAPERGTVLLTIRSLLAENKVSLGALISLEMGKAISEGMGEIQEAIDICDYAIGLSPMLPGKVVPSERRDHFLMESPSPLGVVLVVSAFNFPHAVMFWNFALSFVCGNATVWKPSETAGLIAVATTKLVHKAFRQHKLPVALLSLCCGEVSVSKALVAHPRIPLVSFTGSEKTGRLVSAAVGAKLGRSILELGGNNAIVVLPDANQEMALRTVLFGALGTAGQRCTSTRRLLLHQSIAEDFVERLSKAYANVINTHRIGDPLDQAYLMGPVHTAVAVDAYNAALVEAQKQGGRLLCGGSAVKHLKQGYEKGFWVQPAMVFHADRHPEIMEEETFAPILRKRRCPAIRFFLLIFSCSDARHLYVQDPGASDRLEQPRPPGSVILIIHHVNAISIRMVRSCWIGYRNLQRQSEHKWGGGCGFGGNKGKPLLQPSLGLPQLKLSCN